MWDVLTWIAVLFIGGVVAIVAGSVFIWALFWVQNGGKDE